MYPVSAWFSYKVQHVRLSICESVSVCVCLCVCYMFVCVFLWVCVSVSICLCVSLCICALRTIERRQRIAGGRRNRHRYHSPSSFFNESGSIWQAQDWRSRVHCICGWQTLPRLLGSRWWLYPRNGIERSYNLFSKETQKELIMLGG